MPTPRFGPKIQAQAPNRVAAEAGGATVTTEVVSTTSGLGYTIRGFPTPTRSNLTLNDGDLVSVLWKTGKPFMILEAQGRKGPGSDDVVGGPIVEMLALAPATASSTMSTGSDIWFRNYNQNTLLNCRTQITAAGFTIGSSSLRLHAWSLDHRRFVVGFTNSANSHPILAVFKIGTTETIAIQGTAKATLETTYDLGASTIGLGNITWHQDPATDLSTSIVLGTLMISGYTILFGLTPVQSASASITDIVLRRDKHLILGLTVRIVDQDNSLAGFGVVNFNFPVLIDITAGTVLFNGLQNASVWPGNIYDGAHFVNDGVGEFNITTNRMGGTQVVMLPTKGGNALRVFAATRGTTNPQAPSATTYQAVSAWVIDGGSSPTTFAEYTQTGNDAGRIWVITKNRRYVMWSRAHGDFGLIGDIGGNAFGAPFSNTLAGYDFKEGIHITDLGPGEALALADAVPIPNSPTTIFPFVDATPFLVSFGLLYQDFNDLRVLPPDRESPHFSVFRGAGGTVVVPFPMFPASLRTLSALATADDLKPLTATHQFILTSFLDGYDVSGHSDPVVGYDQVAIRVRVQVIPRPSAPIPRV